MLLESTTAQLRGAWLSAGDLTAPAPRALQAPLVAECLRLPLQVLLRCTPNGPEATAADLLELAHGAGPPKLRVLFPMDLFHDLSCFFLLSMFFHDLSRFSKVSWGMVKVKSVLRTSRWPSSRW